MRGTLNTDLFVVADSNKKTDLRFIFVNKFLQYFCKYDDDDLRSIER